MEDIISEIQKLYKNPIKIILKDDKPITSEGTYNKVFEITDDESIRKIVRLPKTPLNEKDLTIYKKSIDNCILASEQNFGPKIYFPTNTSTDFYYKVDDKFMPFMIMDCYDNDVHNFVYNTKKEIRNYNEIIKQIISLIDLMLANNLQCFDIKLENFVINVIDGKYDIKMIDFDDCRAYKMTIFSNDDIKTILCVQLYYRNIKAIKDEIINQVGFKLFFNIWKKIMDNVFKYRCEIVNVIYYSLQDIEMKEFLEYFLLYLIEQNNIYQIIPKSVLTSFYEDIKKEIEIDIKFLNKISNKLCHLEKITNIQQVLFFQIFKYLLDTIFKSCLQKFNTPSSFGGLSDYDIVKNLETKRFLEKFQTEYGTTHYTDICKIIKERLIKAYNLKEVETIIKETSNFIEFVFDFYINDVEKRKPIRMKKIGDGKKKSQSRKKSWIRKSRKKSKSRKNRKSRKKIKSHKKIKKRS